jgi:redox-sensitive bicupin YhaK (pirin superfamily)
MSAGKGVYHQELPGPRPNGVQGFQFWVNMPAKEKLNQPNYKYIKKGEMKSFKEDGKEVRVIAGKYNDIVGPIDKSNLGITMLHVSLDAGKELTLNRQVGKNGYLFLFEGSGTMNDEYVNSITAYTLNEGELVFKAKSNVEFIYAEGTPLNEPIAWKGPIVMNTEEELYDTFRDLRDGTF